MYVLLYNCTLFPFIKRLFLETARDLRLSCFMALIFCLPQLFVYLQVYGIPRLRVVDASIMPNIVSGEQLKNSSLFHFFNHFKYFKLIILVLKNLLCLSSFMF
jgi:hypothetical protein